jgi:hypothetical protein
LNVRYRELNARRLSGGLRGTHSNKYRRLRRQTMGVSLGARCCASAAERDV